MGEKNLVVKSELESEELNICRFLHLTVTRRNGSTRSIQRSLEGSSGFKLETSMYMDSWERTKLLKVEKWMRTLA